MCLVAEVTLSSCWCRVQNLSTEQCEMNHNHNHRCSQRCCGALWCWGPEAAGWRLCREDGGSVGAQWWSAHWCRLGGKNTRAKWLLCLILMGNITRIINPGETRAYLQQQLSKLSVFPKKENKQIMQLWCKVCYGDKIFFCYSWPQFPASCSVKDVFCASRYLLSCGHIWKCLFVPSTVVCETDISLHSSPIAGFLGVFFSPVFYFMVYLTFHVVCMEDFTQKILLFSSQFVTIMSEKLKMIITHDDTYLNFSSPIYHQTSAVYAQCSIYWFVSYSFML